MRGVNAFFSLYNNSIFLMKLPTLTSIFFPFCFVAVHTLAYPPEVPSTANLPQEDDQDLYLINSHEVKKYLIETRAKESGLTVTKHDAEISKQCNSLRLSRFS